MIHWLIFVFVALPVQALVYLGYPFVVWYFRKKIKLKHAHIPLFSKPLMTLEGALDYSEDLLTLRDKYFLNNQDNHGAMSHGALWGLEPKFADVGLKLLVRDDGGMRRRWPKDDELPASGDCLVSWCWAYEAAKSKDLATLERVAEHFVRNVFRLQHTNGKCTARAANGGISLVFDGWRGLSQPCFGPQYYAGAALLSLAKNRLGGKWRYIYWAHYVLMGGWLWPLEPVLHTKTDPLYYVQDMTVRSLWVIGRNEGVERVKRAMLSVITLTHNQNPFFFAHAINLGIGTACQSMCTNLLLSFRGGHTFLPQKNPDDIRYLERAEAPKHQSVVAFALKLILGKI